MLDRRLFLGTFAASVAGCAEAAKPQKSEIETDPAFVAIRSSLGSGGRLGVMAIDTADGRRVGFDQDSRYAMASTFKLALAGFVLRLSETGALRLEEQLRFVRGDPLDNSPVVEANLGKGSLPVGVLLAAIVQRSDNSAANLLLHRTGGPEALTRFVRACGDRTTRMDRFEMALNQNRPGDPRDTTTPAAMAELVRQLVLGNVLSARSRASLAGWLKTSVPKPDRLRAGIPASWVVGHKPGTGGNGACNDIGVIWRPSGRAIAIASYISGGTAASGVRAAAHASVARLIASRLV